jgi:dynein heavy chain
LAEELKIQIEYFKPYIVVLQSLRNPGIRPRHLEDISKRTGITISMSPDLTFRKLLSLNIMEFQEIIKDTSETAAKEHAIEEALRKMKSDWQTLKMEVIPYKNTG